MLSKSSINNYSSSKISEWKQKITELKRELRGLEIEKKSNIQRSDAGATQRTMSKIEDVESDIRSLERKIKVASFIKDKTRDTKDDERKKLAEVDEDED
jgi:hypothetical protein